MMNTVTAARPAATAVPRPAAPEDRAAPAFAMLLDAACGAPETTATTAAAPDASHDAAAIDMPAPTKPGARKASTPLKPRAAAAEGADTVALAASDVPLATLPKGLPTAVDEAATNDAPLLHDAQAADGVPASTVLATLVPPTPARPQDTPAVASESAAMATAATRGVARGRDEPPADERRSDPPASADLAAAAPRAMPNEHTMPRAASEASAAQPRAAAPAESAPPSPAVLPPPPMATPTAVANATPTSPTGAPFTAHLAAALDSPAFAPALAHQVRWCVEGGVQQAQLTLNPAELGPVAVRIALDGAQARVDFTAEVAATRAVIESSLPTLAAALADGGLTLTGGGVFDGSSSRQHAHPDAPPRANARRGSDAPQAEAARALSAALPPTRGLVDLVA